MTDHTQRPGGSGPGPSRSGGRAPGARPRRPAFFGPVVMDTFLGDEDPAQRIEAAHLTAAALVRHARTAQDPELTARLIALADDGLDEIAELWSSRPASSLPGALWRIYVLRAGIRRDPIGISRAFEQGRLHAPVHGELAAVAEPPGPAEVQELADAVLAGAFSGDLATALERAAAFCHVVATGLLDQSDQDPAAAARLSQQAKGLARTGTDLDQAAHHHRAGHLD